MANAQIELKFAKDVTSLAGYPYGEHTFNECVKDKINYGEEVTLIFPNHIERIASSFVQGFFSEIKCKIGIHGIEKYFKIMASSDRLIDSIFRNLR